ncbi:MAG: hypothetical protein II060_14935 [Bacteroidales bacterium]|nr:hypothetical protein [Bacteroidales bacterium]
MKVKCFVKILLVIFLLPFCSCKEEFECIEYDIIWAEFKEYVQLNSDAYKSATYEDFGCFDELYDKCKSTDEKIKESCNTTVQHIHTHENPMNPDYPIRHSTYDDSAYPCSYYIYEICEYISEMRKTVNIKDVDRRKSRFEKKKEKVLKYVDKVINS